MNRMPFETTPTTTRRGGAMRSACLVAGALSVAGLLGWQGGLRAQGQPSPASPASPPDEQAVTHFYADEVRSDNKDPNNVILEGRVEIVSPRGRITCDRAVA